MPSSPESFEGRSQDILRNRGKIESNKDIQSALSLVDNPSIRRQFPEVSAQKPQDRSYFQALYLNSILPADRKGYESVKRDQINVADPFNMLQMSDAQRGQWVIDNLPQDVVAKIDSGNTDPQRLGEVLGFRIQNAVNEWNQIGAINDDFLKALPLIRYRFIRENLDSVLKSQGIRIPENEIAMGQPNTGLNRAEYLSVLGAVWKGDLTFDQINKSATQGVDDVRALIGGFTGVYDDIQRTYVDLSLEEMGPSESLNALNLIVTPDLRSAYLLSVRGMNPSFPTLTDPEKAAMEPTVILKPDETASTWPLHPERAFRFLSAYGVVPGSRNQEFLRSLEYHFLADDSRKQEMGDPPMSEADTRATLNLVSQSLVESERVVDNTSRQRLELANSKNFGANIEETMGNVWEYMKDVRSHPVGSAALWIGGILAVRAAYKFMTSNEKSWWRTGLKALGLGAIIGGGIGLYQQNRTGHAWWEDVGNKINEWTGRERMREPEEQTLPNYWAKQLSLNDERGRVMLGILGENPSGPVLDWYGNMEVWKKNGSVRSERPKMPIRVSPKLKQFFGKENEAQRSDAFYELLRKFMVDRGRAVRRELPEYTSGTPMNDDESLGYAYMRDRYMEQVFFQSAVNGIIKIGEITVEGSTITQWDPNSPELQELKEKNPSVYATIVSIREGYERETRERQGGNWDMDTIFLMEANPEILRRMNADGNQAATFLDEIARRSTEAAKYAFMTGPEERANQVDLFKKTAAEKLLQENGQLFMGNNPNQLPLLIQQDWNEFVDSLPADTPTKAYLKSYMELYSVMHANEDRLQLLNTIEDKKYQLTIAATQAKTLIGMNAIGALDPKNDATWNVSLDRIMDLADPVLSQQWSFPKMDRFEHLKSLFDSEAYDQGGVSKANILRIFPRWKESNFKELDARVLSYQDAFARLRFMPTIRPGVVLTPDQINGLEKQLSRRMANETMKALLITHGSNLADRADRRTVSPVELSNLSRYFDEAFAQVMGASPDQINPQVNAWYDWRTQGAETVEDMTKDAMKNLYALHGIAPEKYDEYVAKEKAIQSVLTPEGNPANLMVTTMGTEQVAIGISTFMFVNMPERPVSFRLSWNNSILPDVLPEQAILQMPIQKFLNTKPEDIILEWKKSALNDRVNSLTASRNDLQIINENNAFEFIQYGVGANPKQRLSLLEFLNKSDSQIIATLPAKI